MDWWSDVTSATQVSWFTESKNLDASSYQMSKHKYIWKISCWYKWKVSLNFPSGHMTLIQRRHNVNATSWRCIDVEPTLYKRHVPTGSRLYRQRKLTVFYSATNHWAEERDTNIHRFVTFFKMFSDVIFHYPDVRLCNVFVLASDMLQIDVNACITTNKSAGFRRAMAELWENLKVNGIFVNF